MNMDQFYFDGYNDDDVVKSSIDGKEVYFLRLSTDKHQFAIRGSKFGGFEVVHRKKTLFGWKKWETYGLDCYKHTRHEALMYAHRIHKTEII